MILPNYDQRHFLAWFLVGMDGYIYVALIFRECCLCDFSSEVLLRKALFFGMQRSRAWCGTPS